MIQHVAPLGLDEGLCLAAEMVRRQLPGVAQTGLMFAVRAGGNAQVLGNLPGQQVAGVDPFAGQQPLCGPLEQAIAPRDCVIKAPLRGAGR
jgi:hypothetical protein